MLELAQSLSRMAYSAENVPFAFWQAFIEALDEPEYPVARGLDEYRKPFDAVVLATGGLDSTYAYGLAREAYDTVLPLYLDFGQSYKEAELAALDRLGITVRKDVMKPLGHNPKWKHILPARNLIALLHAAELGRTVYFGVTQGESPDQGGDKSARFLSLIQQVCPNTRFETLLDATKVDIVAAAIEAGQLDRYLKTYSCFTGEVGWQCGKCQSCLRRYIAFAANGVPDDDILYNYRAHPLQGPYVTKYKYLLAAELLRPGLTTYGPRRSRQDLGVVAPDVLREVASE